MLYLDMIGILSVLNIFPVNKQLLLVQLEDKFESLDHGLGKKC